MLCMAFLYYSLRIHWKFIDADNADRFEVPFPINDAGNGGMASNPLYEIVFDNEPTFSFQVNQISLLVSVDIVLTAVCYRLSENRLEPYYGTLRLVG